MIFVGGFEEGLRLKNGKFFSRNFRDGYRVYNSNGLGCTITSQGGGLGGNSGLYLIET